MPPAELGFAVMCDGSEFEDWEADCIGTLCDTDGVRLELLVDVGDDRTGPGGLRGRTDASLDREDARTTINRAAWELYRTPFRGPRCEETTDLSDRLASVERIHCDVQADGVSRHVHEGDVREIREYGLDFVLQFSSGTPGGVLGVPTYGVWSFHRGDPRKYRGEPPCFWEMYDGEPVTGAALRRLTDRPDEAVVLREGFFETNRHFYGKTLDNVSYGMAEWPAQVAIDILNGNDEYVDRPPAELDAPIRRPPSPSQILRYNVKRGYSLVTTQMRGIDHWNVGVSQAPIHESTTEAFDPRIDWFPQRNRDGFIADPFPMTIDGTTYVFVEEFPYSDWKGKISYVEYPDGFERGELETAHEEPFHMSYPYLFEHGGDVYCTPEMRESNEIRLYRVVAPSDWRVESTLVRDTEGEDPTVIRRDGRWWMFYTVSSEDNTKLRIQYSDELTGGWQPHENNPVKTDVRSSRPGGTPFVEDGELYRPAQYCAGEYGKKLVVNRVDTLTPTRYSEEEIAEIRPADGSPYTGVHTLSSRGSVTLIDGKRTVWNRYTPRRRLAELASHLR